MVANFSHFVFRKLALHLNSIGIIVMHGGLGTLDEVFEVLYRGKPTVMLGKEFWTPIMDSFQSIWYEAVIDVNLYELMLITDDEDEAVEEAVGGAQIAEHTGGRPCGVRRASMIVGHGARFARRASGCQVGRW